MKPENQGRASAVSASGGSTAMLWRVSRRIGRPSMNCSSFNGKEIPATSRQSEKTMRFTVSPSSGVALAACNLGRQAGPRIAEHLERAAVEGGNPAPEAPASTAGCLR